MSLLFQFFSVLPCQDDLGGKVGVVFGNCLRWLLIQEMGCPRRECALSKQLDMPPCGL